MTKPGTIFKVKHEHIHIFDSRQVTQVEAAQLAKDNAMAYIETSAKTGTNVEQAFVQLAQQIHKKVKDGIIDVNHESSGVRPGQSMAAGSGAIPGRAVHIAPETKKEPGDEKGCC